MPREGEGEGEGEAHVEHLGTWSTAAGCFNACPLLLRRILEWNRVSSTDAHECDCASVQESRPRTTLSMTHSSGAIDSSPRLLFQNLQRRRQNPQVGSGLLRLTDRRGTRSRVRRWIFDTCFLVFRLLRCLLCKDSRDSARLIAHLAHEADNGALTIYGEIWWLSA